MPNELLPAAQSEQREPPLQLQTVPTAVPDTGRRLAFQDIKRQLTEQDLVNPGTQKLILDLLLTTEAERDELKVYVPKYYEAEKRACILQEKLSSNKTNEVLFGVGVGVGGTIMGLAPFFWTNAAQGAIALGVGAVLVIGATLGRILYK